MNFKTPPNRSWAALNTRACSHSSALAFASLLPVDYDPLERGGKRGLPIGNVTSQIFANIYLNELDQFIKHKLKVKYYFRYADDLAFIHQDADYLQNVLKPIIEFLEKSLLLRLHPNKVSIKKFSRGFDFLGYVSLPYYKIIRTKTKKRMMKKLIAKQKLLVGGIIDEEKFKQSLKSYLGILSHCRGHKIELLIKEKFGD